MRKLFHAAGNFVALALLFPAMATAGALSGVVRNGTTGAVVPGQDVILFQLQGGMQPLETVKTDAQGRYIFNRPEIGQAPMLLRVEYAGAKYHQNVPPGQTTADVEVFDATATAAALDLVSHTIIFQPNGATLLVGEEFSVHNESKPPATYTNNAGTFEFVIPEGAQLAQVSAAGPAGMPLVQGTIDKGKDRFAIAFPLKPGANTIRISYQLPYTSNQARLTEVSTLAARRVVLAAPTSMHVSSESFAPAGSEQGYSLYSREKVPANRPFAILVSGTAPPPSGDGSSDAPDRGAGDSAPAETSSNLQAFPPRIGSVQWILIAGFAVLFGLGAVYLWRQPRAAPAGVAPAAEKGEASTSRSRSRGRAAREQEEAEPRRAPNAVAQVEQGVRVSLDEMKDTLFRLELRHQAGTISEEEYTRERSRLEHVLRDLVKG